jgi:mannose-6-phosphate isomerase-like protein (cupin superfamily)
MPTAVRSTEPRWFTGARARILVAEETFSLLDQELPHGEMPPLHVHHEHDEVFFVMRGRVSVHLPGTRIDLGPGDSAFAPRGVPHSFRVESEDGTRVLAATTSGEFAAFVEETSMPAEGDGFAPEGVLPGPAGLTEAAARHGIEILGPPGALPA